MMEKVGQIQRNQLEDVWVSLCEFHGEPHLELRVYPRAALSDSYPLPRQEGIVLPINLLPDLLRVLMQAQELLLMRGLLHVPSPTSGTTLDRGEPTTVRLAPRPGPQPRRRHPRVPVNLPVKCHPLGPGNMKAGMPLSGEIKDVSLGGAQIWLPKRLPRYSRLEVAAVIEGIGFRVQAEVVGVEIEAKRDAKTGYHRHSLQWVAMDATAKAVLSKVLPIG